MEALIIWNIVVFAAYAFDKYNAIVGRPRISEKTLLAFAFLMGGFGAFLGMYTLKHKTRHRIFKICIPLALLLNIACIYLAASGILNDFISGFVKGRI